jgi:hypothetical protein
MKKYLSKYSNGKTVSAAQYITEIICEHKAKKDKKDLHYRFWTTPYWSKFYRDQIASANKLIKEYSPDDIISAINSQKAQQIYSLRAPFLKPIIEEAAAVNQKKNHILSKQFDRQEKINFRKHKPKQNIISKLEDLENND